MMMMMVLMLMSMIRIIIIIIIIIIIHILTYSVFLTQLHFIQEMRSYSFRIWK